MLNADMKRQIAYETRETVRAAYRAEMQAQNHIIPKRFSPNVDINEVNQGVNMYSTGKIYTREHPEGIDEPDHSFATFGNFALDIIRASQGAGSVESPRLRDWAVKTAGTLEIGDSAAGGYLVPSQFSNTLMARALEQSVVRSRCFHFPMTTNRCELPAIVDSSHSSTFYGGIDIKRTGEGSQLDASAPAYELISLTLHKVSGLCHVTNELIEDNPIGLEAHLNNVFPQSIAFVMDDDFLNGTGANQPIGMLNAANPALITVSAVSGQGSSTVIAENISDMWSRMYSPCKRTAIWLYLPDVFPQLFNMSLAVGTAAVPIWLLGGGVSAEPYQTLFGRPLIETEKCQTLGTAGDIALVDLVSYCVASKGGNAEIKFASSIHLKFDYDMQSFRWVARYDAQPLWKSALTLRYSSTTVSPFVVLSSTRT